MARKKHRSHRGYSGGKGDGNLFPILATSAVYGAVRPTAVNALAPVTNMLPFSGYNDELALGLIGYFMAKKMSNPWAKTLGKSMLIVEAASLGSQISGGVIGEKSSAGMQTIG